jgi:hypothetical protein
MFRAVFLPIIRSFVAVQRHRYNLCSSVTEWYQGQDTGITRSPSCINCTYAVVRLRSSWWWAERLPETYRVIIPIINLELSASVGFFTRNALTLLQYKLMKFVLKNWTPNSQATTTIDVMKKNQLMFQVTIIFITRILGNTEIQFVDKRCRNYSRQSVHSSLVPGA